MAYTPIGWLNNQAPAINQTNLNKMDNELVLLDANDSNFADQNIIISDNGLKKSMIYRNDYSIGGINISDGSLNPSQTSRFSSSDWIKFNHPTIMYVESGYQVLCYSKNPDTGNIGASSWRVGPNYFVLDNYQDYKISVWKTSSWSARKPDIEKKFVLFSTDSYHYNLLNKINIEKIMDGKITPDWDFFTGNLNNTTGVVTPTGATRVITPYIRQASADIHITVNTGYRFAVYKYASDDSYIGETGWRTSYKIEAGERFRIWLAQDPDHSGNLSVDDLIEFEKNINVLLNVEVTDSSKNEYPFLSGGNKPKLAAHMGYHYTNVPANTLPAFIEAGKRGYWGIESDVRETSDGHFIMMHDNDVSTTTDGTGNVNELTYEYIRGLHMTANPSVGVPSLEEYLGTCKQYGCVAIPEIKGMTHFDEFVKLIKDFALENSCIVIGSKWTLSTFRANEPLIPYMAIYQNAGSAVDIDSEIAFLKAYENTGMDLDSTFGIQLSDAKKVHSAGLIFGTFTVDNADTAKHDFQNGIDFVTTNSVLPED